MTALSIDTPRIFQPLLRPTRYKGVHGGRGSGKSHFFAEMLIERCLMAKTDAVCVREIQKSLNQSVKKLLEMKIEALGVGSLFEVQEAVIKCPNGGKIIFNGLQNHTADSIKSLEGYDIAWCEEAQSLSQRSLDILRPTIRKANSEIWFSWNPESSDDPIDKFLRGGNPPPDSVVVEANYMDNPWFPEVLQQEMEYDRGRDIDKYNHVWMGEYAKNSEARVFRNWVVDEFEAPRGITFRLGADWGYSVDPSVLVRCYTEGRTLFVDYEAYMVGCEIDQLPMLFDRVPESKKWFIVADSARPETISYMRNHGYPKINAAMKGARSIEEGIEFLRSYDIVVHPRCENLIHELTNYSYKTDPLTGEVLPILSDKDNHCLVAGTMVETQRGSIPIEQATTADYVQTRAGYRRVLFSGRTDINRNVVEVKTTHGSLTCTPDHEVFTSNRGFVRADALRYNDEIMSLLKGDESWLKHSSTTARHTGVTQRAIGAAIGFISSVQSLAERCGCIARSGLILMAQSLMGCTSITRTGTLSTTTYQTSIACLPKNTLGGMSGTMRGLPSKHFISNLSGISQRYGMPVLKGWRFIVGLAQCLIKDLYQHSRNASNAVRNSIRRSLDIKTYSAQTSVSLLIDAQSELITNQEHVLNVAMDSPATNTAKPLLALGHVLTVTEAGIAKEVFDLTIEDQHEFFANGVLVHNCIDSLRYGLEGIRKAAKPNPINVKPFQTFDSGMGLLG